jgi:hypothetical protein
MDPIRIANCSGFFGDRSSAAREMVEGGPIDVLTGDYLAELTMAILARHRLRDPDAGYVPTFLDQMEEVLGTCAARGIRIVANAGGLNPDALAGRVSELAGRLGVEMTVASVTGDDVLAGDTDLRDEASGRSLVELGTPLTANAYLGGWGIAEALRRGADVVVTGRVADASLVVGPAAWRHDWRRDDWDALAGAVVAGHVIECGTQATGGNYSFFEDIPGLTEPGFPIVDVAADGSSVVTKHEDTGGAVSTGTVTAQLLYEVGGPRYLNPDVVARLDTVTLTDLGADRVGISGVCGEPPPPTTKVAATVMSGHRNDVTFVIPGLDVDAKAALVQEALWRRLGGRDRFTDVDVRLMKTGQDDPPSHEAAFSYLRVTVTAADAELVGRSFSNAAIELALANYPGFLVTAPPTAARPLVRFVPASMPQPTTFVSIGSERVAVPPSTPGSGAAPPPRHASPTPPAALDEEPVVRVPLGRLAGARSGDKGGDANLGVWVRSDDAFAWLDAFLTTDRLRTLIPEAQSLDVERHVFATIRAVNFVLHGYLGDGVASSTRWDPQAKGLGEYLRARYVAVPERLVMS